MNLAFPVALSMGLAVLAGSTPAHSLDHQLHVSPRLGFAWTNGRTSTIGPLAEVGVGYGLNDAFALYTNLGYALCFSDVTTINPQHFATLSAGARYALDYLSVVPWIALGLRADLFVTPTDGHIGPSVEARVGAAWLLRRGLGLELEASYAFPWLFRDQVSDIVTVSLGLRFVRDL